MRFRLEVKRIFIFCLALLFAYSGSLLATTGIASDILLKKGTDNLKPYHQIVVLEDIDNNLSPQQVYQKLISGEGKKLSDEVPNFGITKSAFWFYFVVNNQSAEEDWHLLIEHHLIREVDFYQLEEDIWRAKLYSGTSRPWLNRKVDNAYFIYPLELTSKKQVYLLRVLNRDPLIVPLSLLSNSQLQKKLTFSLWISGLYWGLILALMIYNAFLYFSTKQSNYLYYVIYMMSFAGYLLIYESWSHSFAFSWNIWLSDNGIHLTIPLTLACALFFVVKFLNIKKFFPRIYQIAQYAIFWAGFLVLLAPWLESTLHTILMMLSLQVFSIFVIVIGFKSWQKGNFDAPYFLIAWGVLLSGVVMTNLMYLGVFPFNWFTSSGSNIGGVAEMLLLSFVLAASINRTRQQQKSTELAHFNMLKQHVIALDKSNRYKDDFLNIISHELRTPLHGIRASLDLILDRVNSTEMEKEFLMLNYSASEMERRISDLLIFTDLGSGKFKLHNHPFDSGILIDELQNKFRDLAEDKFLGWQFSVDKNIPQWLIGDRQYLKLIYSQLLDNAIKFTSTGFISIFFDITSNGVLQVTIKDTGVGFDKDLLNELDKAFVQADSSINRHASGLGLGLTLCQQLITLMHGSFSFESKINQGTSVTVCIPALIASEEQVKQLINKKAVKKSREHEQAQIDVQADLTSISGPHIVVEQQDKSILIVEDNHVNRMVMGNMLKHLGYFVSFAENGQLAVDVCNQEKFDLILMDCQMPVMDGVTATLIIRKQGLNQQTPIIAVTANAMSNDNEICLKAGMNQHLPKPVRLTDLAASIKYWIEYSF